MALQSLEMYDLVSFPFLKKEIINIFITFRKEIIFIKEDLFIYKYLEIKFMSYFVFSLVEYYFKQSS